MKALEYPLLADENIDRSVVDALREEGKDILTVSEIGLLGATDTPIIRWAYEHGRVVLTHDSDFGTLAIRGGEAHSGLLYIRPGHIKPIVVLNILKAVEEVKMDVGQGFILVAEARGEVVRVRLRTNL